MKWFKVALAAMLLPMPALASDAPVLPKTLAWTTHDVGTSGYNQSIAIGKALQDAYGISLRVLAMSTDQSRLVPARDGRVPYALSGTDTFYAFEGVLSYAAPGWGPQKISALSIVGSDNCADMGVAADAGVKQMSDLRGKRVGRVVGSPALQANVRAFLAFGGLTEKDVEMVDMPSYAAAWQALTNGDIDAHTAVTSGGVIEQAAAGPRGLYWVPLPHTDDAAWARMQAVNPHFSKTRATLGANLSKDKPLECAGVPYPVLVTYADNADLDYNVTKAITEQVPNFESAEPAASGWRGEKQVFSWVVPYSEGAVRYWKEAGLWNDTLQAANDRLFVRQKVILDAWKQMDGAPEDGFAAKWLAIRAKALEDAGFPAYFH
jgi:uncharacterized protein